MQHYGAISGIGWMNLRSLRKYTGVLGDLLWVLFALTVKNSPHLKKFSTTAGGGGGDLYQVCAMQWVMFSEFVIKKIVNEGNLQ